MERSMDALVEQLNAKLLEWQPEVAQQVRQSLAEIIELADQGGLDLLRSRTAEQEVLDLLDELKPGDVWLVDLGLAAKTRLL
jgi:hypothetical protein